MIGIKLVRVGGVLVGKTASDRWNMLQLGLGHAITADRNQAAIKRLRREWGSDFTFTVSSREMPVWSATPAEIDALGSKIGKVAA
jgi:hypothetical protein